MEINIPEVVAEVTEAHARYERALMGNRPDELIELFWSSPLTVRFGIAENLYGHEEIAGYRREKASSGGAARRDGIHAVVTTFGRDFATTNLEYVRPGTGARGRQSQAWVRTAEGWRIVSAHVSLLGDTD